MSEKQEYMKSKTTLKNYWWIGFLVLALILSVALMGFHSLFKPKTPPEFGYHALKINGRFVGPEIFFKEKNSFFMRWRRNAEMLRKTDEERMDLMLEEIIEQTLIEDYLYRYSGITVNAQEADEYINRYIKPKHASPEDFNSFLQNADYTSEADMQKDIILYLLKLKCFSKMAKEKGLTIPPAELDLLYQKHVDENHATAHPKTEFYDMTLMERFGKSGQFKTWIAGIKSKSSIEIMDPAMKAYRLYREGRYDQAGALYEKIFGERQKEFHLERALQSYKEAENWAKVIRLSQTGMRRYPDKTSYVLDKAEGFYRKGRTDEALKLLKNVESRSVESVYLKSLIVQTYETLGLGKEAERVKNTVPK
jgi:tetratricopeptide (TPR) repeat protein